MAANKSVQQYQPLRIPSNWGPQEKKFIVQLTDILDDIYRRYGRFKLTDLGVELRDLVAGTITADRIDVDNLYVKHLDAADGTFNGNAAIVNPENTNEQMLYGASPITGEFGLWATQDNWTSQIMIANPFGSNGGSIIPGSLPNAVDAYTSLLLHFFGENDSVSFTNSSQYPQTITPYGDAKISTAQSKFGGSAGHFDGSGDYLSVPDSEIYNVSSGDFTIDCWVRIGADSSSRTIVCKEATSAGYYSFRLSVLSTKYLYFTYSITGSANVHTQSTQALSENAWHHVAVVRNGSYITMYINGTACGSVSIGTDSIHDSTNRLTIGAADTGGTPGQPFVGYIDELRVSKGIARWTANFTPPTEAYTG